MTGKSRTRPIIVAAISSIIFVSMISIATQFQQNVAAQNSSNSNPLAKVPVIGKLLGGGKANNATTSSTTPPSSSNTTSTSSSAGNSTATSSSTSNQSSSNPLAKIPVIGKLLGGK